MLVVRETAPRRPSLEVAVSHALVERVNEGELTGSHALVERVNEGELTGSHALVERDDKRGLGSVLRLYRPAPTVAFGRLDALRPGFSAAAAAARAHGFDPVLRAPGGHAVAYHEGSLGIDEVIGEADPIAGMHDRFARSGELLAGALRTLGVDARVGRVPAEFCPGDFTVNARGAVKLVGTAQRVVRHASLLAASVVVVDPEPVRAVLVDVYRALELDWDPRTLAGVADEAAGVGIDDVERAVLDAYGVRGDADASPVRGDSGALDADASPVRGDSGALDAETLERARGLEPRHRISAGSPAAPTRSRQGP